MDVRDVKTLHLSVQGEENEVDGYGAGGPTWMPSKIGGGAAIHRKQETDLFFTVLCFHTHTAFLCLWSAAGSVVLQLITAEWRTFKVSTSYKIAGRNITHRRRYKWKRREFVLWAQNPVHFEHSSHHRRTTFRQEFSH